MIRFLDNASNGYGTGVSIGGGGATVIGGGESAINAEPALTANDSEVLWLCNDGNIDFYTRYQDGSSSAVHTYIDTNGVFHTLGLTGDLFKVVNSANVNKSISGNSGVEVKFSVTIPSGYIGLCYGGYSTSGPGGAINVYSSASINPVITGKGPGTYTCSVWFRNYTGTTYSADLSIQIICIKGTTA